MIMKLSIGIHLTLKVLCANILWKSGSEGYIKGQSEDLIFQKRTEMSREYQFLSQALVLNFRFLSHFHYVCQVAEKQKATCRNNKSPKKQKFKKKQKLFVSLSFFLFFTERKGLISQRKGDQHRYKNRRMYNV